MGASVLGEILYGEADTPIGPWVYTQKVVTHNSYSLYNPWQHPHYEKDNGRVIYFEGTYTTAFSGAKVGVPRYNYNQVMFKLELDDPRLFLPVPVYRLEEHRQECLCHLYRTNGDVPEDYQGKREIPFFAPDRPREGTVPVYEVTDPKTGALVLTADAPQEANARIVFYAEEAAKADPSPATALLYEHTHRASKSRIYSDPEGPRRFRLQENETANMPSLGKPDSVQPLRRGVRHRIMQKTNDSYFRITVIDEATGRGVPAVKLTTMHAAVYHTDSAGVIAFHEPGLIGQLVHFEVETDGYTVIKDGSGGPKGVTFKIAPGECGVVRMQRQLAAQRLYRITGADIYRDSLLLGDEAPVKEPLLNAMVTGQDSTLVTRYKDRLFWAWGDTCSPRFSNHWNFKVTCATSPLPGNGTLDPDKGIDLTYFTKEDGFTKQMAPLPGGYLYWLWGMISLKDETGRERLFSSFMRIQPGNLVGDRLVHDDEEKEKKPGKPETSTEKEKKKNWPSFSIVGHGVVEFNDEKEIFESVWEREMETPVINFGHPFRHRENGTDYIYYPPAWPNVRVKADVASLMDPDSFEGFTCLKEGCKFDGTAEQLDRAPDGSLRYSWKTKTSPIGPRELNKLAEAGHIKPEEGWARFRETETGAFIGSQHNTVNWNAYRERWIMITGQAGGTSPLGEILYAEGDTPLGPWVYTQKIVTHDNYSFYNPCHHPHSDKDGGRVIYFEGTYTRSFTTNPVGTPRYNYNQIMYKMDLEDPRLFVPVPVYCLAGEANAYRTKKDVPRRLERPARDPLFRARSSERRHGAGLLRYRARLHHAHDGQARGAGRRHRFLRRALCRRSRRTGRRSSCANGAPV